MKTKLKLVGKKYLGKCPFHKEKTPSFTVDPKTGEYYCFGCKASGSWEELKDKVTTFSGPKEMWSLDGYPAYPPSEIKWTKPG